MQLQANQQLWVQVIAQENSGRGLNCAVVSASPTSVTIRFPRNEAMPDGLLPGCSVLLRITNEQGVHTAFTHVLRVTSTPSLMMTVATPKSFATKQQRKFFRVIVQLPASCTIVESWDKSAIGRGDQTAKTQDLSAGGLRLSTTLTLCTGDEVSLLLKPGGPKATDQNLALKGRVLRAEPRVHDRCLAGIEFALEKREQDALVRLMFELQRKNQR